MDKTVKKFIEYVSISSISKEEEAFSKVVVKELKSLGGEVSLDKSGNIFANFNFDKKTRKPIILNAHIDTVFHTGQIKPKITKGWITPSGDTILGADNKAGVVAIIEAVRALKEEKKVF